VAENEAPSIADVALADLAHQLAESAKNLSIVRAQYQQLVAYLESKADVLGLSTDEAESAVAPELAAEVAEAKPETNGKVPAKTG